jgi:HlyD family secretion protein
MNAWKLAGLSAAFTAVLMLADCGKSNDRLLQGWVEAELIFISPDQQGRVEILSVREGDVVTARAPLFTVDDELQQADLAVKKAAVINAQQDFDRAQELLKSATGTQKTYEDAEAVLRQTNANLAASETHLTRRVVLSPSEGTIEQVYYRPRRFCLKSSTTRRWTSPVTAAREG